MSQNGYCRHQLGLETNPNQPQPKDVRTNEADRQNHSQTDRHCCTPQCQKRNTFLSLMSIYLLVDQARNTQERYFSNRLCLQNSSPVQLWREVTSHFHSMAISWHTELQNHRIIQVERDHGRCLVQPAQGRVCYVIRSGCSELYPIIPSNKNLKMETARGPWTIGSNA